MNISSSDQTITIELDVNEASFVHAMLNPNYFLSANELTEMEKTAYLLGKDLKSKLADFVNENYSPFEK